MSTIKIYFQNCSVPLHSSAVVSWFPAYYQHGPDQASTFSTFEESIQVGLLGLKSSQRRVCFKGTIRHPEIHDDITILTVVEFCLIYIPVVLATSFLNFRIIKSLLNNHQLTQQGTEAVRRMTKAFSVLCCSWVLTSLPFKVITMIRQLSLGLYYHGHNDLGVQIVAESKIMY